MHANAKTVVDLIDIWAETKPGQTAFAFLKGEGSVDVSLTFRELQAVAWDLGGLLSEMAPRQARALLLFQPGFGFLRAFFACMVSDIVSVPLAPIKPNRHADTLRKILNNSLPSVVLTERKYFERLIENKEINSVLEGLPVVFVDEAIPQERTTPLRRPQEGSLAFLQYTSGATSAPTGVVVRHANILANLRNTDKGFGMDDQSVFLGWLPLFHDMGLLGTVLQPLFRGNSSYLTNPMNFLTDPIFWLEAVTRYRATISGGPNFAYDLCCGHITPERKANLDLSSWVNAFNGAEPVKASTLRRFEKEFSPCGFRAEAFYPCYGMAEATLFVSGKPKLTPTTFKFVPKTRLGLPTAGESEIGMQEIVGCGRGWCDQDIRIVDPESLKPCPEREVGEIWIAGNNVCGGYWNDAAATESAFGAIIRDGDLEAGGVRYLRTGDLGFLEGDELFITGRRKEMIIVRGANFFPQDLEETVQQSDTAFVNHGGAAFSVQLDGVEKVLLAQEVRRLTPVDRYGDLISKARSAAVEAFPLSVNGKIDLHVLPVPSRQAVEERASKPLEGKEEILRRVWEELLGQSKIAAEDNFFDLGGDSIRAIQMASMVLQHGFQLQPNAILQAQTLGGIAARMIQVTPRPVPADPEPGEDWDYPLAPAQLRFLSSPHGNPGLDHIATVLVLESVDLGALRKSIARAVDTYPHLRTVFRKSGDSWTQKPGEGFHDDSFFRSLAGANAPPDEIGIREWFGQVREGTDIRKGPLFLVAHAAADSGPHYLCISMHHLLGDAAAFRTLVAWLLKEYRNPGSAPSLPETLSYYRWCMRLGKVFSRSTRPEVDFWKRASANPIPRLPNRMDSPPRMRDMETLTVTLPIPGLLASSEPYLTVSMLTLGALAKALGRWSGARVLQIGLIGLGRQLILDGTLQDTAGTLGWMNTLYPLEIEVDPEATLHSLAREIREGMAAVPADGLGFGAGKYLTGELRDLEEPEVIYNFLGRSEPDNLPAGVTHRPDLAGPTRCQENLAYGSLLLEASFIGQELELAFNFDRRRFGTGEMSELVRDMVETLHGGTGA